MIKKIRVNPLLQKRGIIESGYIMPPKVKELSQIFIKYTNAVELANTIEIAEDKRYYVILNGTFVFGDLIEALCVENNWHVKKMYVSTLSFNQNNVDSLANLLNGDFVDELEFIVSTGFESHERYNLLKYMLSELDKNNKFQLAIADTHMKVTLMELHTGEKIVIHGSANLRTSNNIEQVVIEENKALYDFNMDLFNDIIAKYKVINKAVRSVEMKAVLTKDINNVFITNSNF
jgi:hypothetical protein